MEENKLVKNFYFKCEICNKQKKSVMKREKYDNKFICETCYKRELEHPINEKPNIGKVAYDSEGRMICHICGRAYNKLTMHIKQAHKISGDEYKEKFGLNRTFSLTSEKLKNTFRKTNNYKYLKHFKKGYNTLDNSSVNINKGKKRRLQYINNRTETIYNTKNKDEE